MSQDRGLLCPAPPLPEAVLHFAARRNTRSTDTEMGSSNDGDAHTSIAIPANFSARRADILVSSSARFWLFLCRGDLEACLDTFSSPSRGLGLLTRWPGLERLDLAPT